MKPFLQFQVVLAHLLKLLFRFDGVNFDFLSLYGVILQSILITKDSSLTFEIFNKNVWSTSQMWSIPKQHWWKVAACLFNLFQRLAPANTNSKMFLHCAWVGSLSLKLLSTTAHRFHHCSFQRILITSAVKLLPFAQSMLSFFVTSINISATYAGLIRCWFSPPAAVSL